MIPPERNNGNGTGSIAEDAPLLGTVEEGTVFRSTTTGNKMRVERVYLSPSGVGIVEVVDENGNENEMNAAELIEAVRDGRIQPHSYAVKVLRSDHHEARWGKEYRNGDATRVEVRQSGDGSYSAVATDVVDGEEVATTELAWTDGFDECVGRAEIWMAQNPRGVAPEQNESGGGMFGGIFG